MLDHLNMFAQYNRWANQRLFNAASLLDEKDYDRDCGVAFSSMNGTLNHIYIADEIWMSRFNSEVSPHATLGEIVFPAFDDLEESRKVLDSNIINFCTSLDENSLYREFTYTAVTMPETVTQTLAPALAHLFNHQTHHRGQAHAILTRLTGEAPPLDLIYYQRDVRLGETN